MKPTSIQTQIERSLRIDRPCGIRTVASVADTTTEAQKLLFLESIGAVVCHRINYPKVLAGKATPPRKAPKIHTVKLDKEGSVTVKATLARKATKSSGFRPLLSTEEEKDVKQSVALALIACGAYETGKMTFGAWKVAFQSARGKDCLRIDRKAKSGHETLSIDSLSVEEVALIAVKEGIDYSAPRRRMIARKVRQLRQCCFAAFNADKGRQRKSNLAKALRFVAFLSSQYQTTGKGISEILATDSSEQSAMLTSLRSTKKRFMEYHDKGEAILTAESSIVNPDRFNVTLAEGSFATFAQLYAVEG